MKSFKIKKVGVILLLLLLINITMLPAIKGEIYKNEDQEDKLYPHLPIEIEGDSEFTKKNGVRSGTGTKEDPYVISNWRIYPIVRNGIQIRNTDKYFIIENCKIYKNKNPIIGIGPGAGISLFNVTNGVIKNISCYNLKNSFGALIISSSNTTTENCDFYNNRFGISINGCPSGSKLHSNNNIIRNCTCSNCEYGIYFCCLPSSYNNLIHLCKIKENDVGICLDHCIRYTKVIRCNISNNKKGLEIISVSHNNHISNNVFWNNEVHATDNCKNFWDNEQKFGGNYWSGHNTSNPYIVPGAGNNKDCYPLKKAIMNKTLIALFLYFPKILIVNKKVFFNGLLSFEEDEKILKYEWDFGDNTKKIGATTSHEYLFIGKYNVTLKIFNETKNDTFVREIEVLEIEKKDIYVNEGESIQQAINNAKCGNNIIVENGTYFENIVINKPYLNIIGKGCNTTIIDGQKKSNTIYITAPMTNISRFTIKNSSTDKAGLQIGVPDFSMDSFCCNISHNKIIENHIGINMSETDQNKISENIIKENTIGIHGIRSYENNFQKNIICCNEKGIFTEYASNWNEITKNSFTENRIGIFLHVSHYNILSNNNIKNNDIGIKLFGALSPKINFNNICNNYWGGIVYNGAIGNAKNNWWGSKLGPSFIVPIFGDRVFEINEQGRIKLTSKTAKLKSCFPWSFKNIVI